MIGHYTITTELSTYFMFRWSSSVLWVWASQTISIRLEELGTMSLNDSVYQFDQLPFSQLHVYKNGLTLTAVIHYIQSRNALWTHSWLGRHMGTWRYAAVSRNVIMLHNRKGCRLSATSENGGFGHVQKNVNFFWAVKFLSTHMCRQKIKLGFVKIQTLDFEHGN